MRLICRFDNSPLWGIWLARADAFQDNPPPGRDRIEKGKIGMATGALKMWNAERGFGFIADDSGGPDMFLHITALQAAGIDPDNLQRGDRLIFDVESTRDGKTKASNVRRQG
jgi:cold shock protein